MYGLLRANGKLLLMVTIEQIVELAAMLPSGLSDSRAVPVASTVTSRVICVANGWIDLTLTL